MNIGDVMMLKSYKSNKGFTLVELIIILLILAILAAILIPTLLGFIDDAKSKENVLNAKNCLTMIQAKCSELYAKNGDKLTPGNKAENTIVGWENVKGAQSNTGLQTSNGNVNITESVWARTILKELDLKRNDAQNNDDPYEPYCIMFGVGSNVNNSTNADIHDKFIVYFMFYMEKEDSKPIWYFNNEWRNTRPNSSEIDNNNKILVGDKKDMRLQYYVLSNKTGKNPGGNQTFMNWYNSLK